MSFKRREQETRKGHFPRKIGIWSCLGIYQIKKKLEKILEKRIMADRIVSSQDIDSVKIMEVDR